jgi:hypothetical protein
MKNIRRRNAISDVVVVGFAMTAMLTISASCKEEDEDEEREREGEREQRPTEPGVHRAGPAELDVRNRMVAQELTKIAQSQKPSVPATTWVSLGPTNAFKQTNFYEIDGVDSGRPASIVVNPKDANIVYLAASGGGLWKTFNFLSPEGPSWQPIGDLLANLASGDLALDEQNPDTLYFGAGDFVDGSGNTVQKSINGGISWSAPVKLDDVYPSPSGFAAKVTAIRSIDVRGTTVMAGTDVGLFVSQDGGATFVLADLPNRSGQVVPEAIWSVKHVGQDRWVASGVTGCDGQSAPPFIRGTDVTAACPNGNAGDIWFSANGVTWSNAMLPVTAGIGRMTLAAGRGASADTTAVYAYVGSVDGFATVGFWRSLDGGKIWADATGTLANPTASDCTSTNIGQDQTWYNEAIAVDPTNPDHVLVGGSLCGARTLNGTAASPTWENISHWLPNPDSGATANGTLPYVHADWHVATVVSTNAGVRTFAGTDGGIFSSTDLFNGAVPAEQVNWQHHNRGLATHLMYSVASGDPSTNNAFVLFSGLQDNGTRLRADPNNPSVFNQVLGGDGIGATVHSSSTGTVYWGSIQFQRAFCRPSATVTCLDQDDWSGLAAPLNPSNSARLAREEEGSEENRPATADSEPFLIHYANVESDTVGQSVLTHSDGQVFVSVEAVDGTLSWLPISQDLTPSNLLFTNVGASRTTPGLYGATSVSITPFYVSTKGNTATTWVASDPVFATGTLDRLTGASSIDFPPVLPAGTVAGQVFIGSFVGTMNDVNRTPPPDDKGRLWRTNDFGKTWQSIIGADPNHRLPNVPVYVAKYDPVTPTTIYAGTDIGVYISLDDGATWDRMGDGFPIVPVRDMYVAKNQEFIRVATYGRGLWEIYPSSAANQGAPGNGDYDRNLQIDWIDLAAMSSRLGVTPANMQAPLYSWIMDIVGDAVMPLANINDADLNALLTSFGDYP